MTALFHLVVLIVIGFFSPFCESVDHWADIRGQMSVWKCHRGFKGDLGSVVEEGAKKCSAMNIPYRHCFVSCLLHESGIIKNSVWQEDVEHGIMTSDTMWEADAKDEKERWWNGTKLCHIDYDRSGAIFPTEYMKTECKIMNSLHECIFKARKCPEIGGFR